MTLKLCTSTSHNLDINKDFFTEKRRKSLHGLAPPQNTHSS